MERLTRRLPDGTIVQADHEATYTGACDCMAERLAHYEDLQEQGRFVELPCKPGDILYTPMSFPWRVVSCVVIQISMQRMDGVLIMVEFDDKSRTTIEWTDIGQRYFFSCADAEKALTEITQVERV